MIIQHNIPALNAHRNLGINNSATAKNLEKLSSGYRINRAGDDAAGLAISEKMRGQIRGLAMAEQNTSNGINLIQTAEGGLNETHAILQRMRELAVQSSNGTYQDEDRNQIALEVQALKSEVDRIATSTHYNGIKLLDGTLGGIKALSNDGTAHNLTSTAIGTAIGNFTLAQNTAATTDALHQTWGDDVMGTLTATAVRGTAGTVTGYVYSLQVGDETYTAQVAATTAQTAFMYLNGDASAARINLGGINASFEGTISGLKMADLNGSTNGLVVGANTGGAFLLTTHSVISGTNSKLVFQIGANGGADQRVGLQVANMSTGALGTMTAYTINNVTYNGTIASINVKTRETANKAIEVIDAATNQVSSQRASLGALQNRLEHTLNNLGVTKENLTAAESTIRDVDMAKEMMEFTKNNILVQSAQAMLAQANALPQGVLSLLR